MKASYAQGQTGRKRVCDTVKGMQCRPRVALRAHDRLQKLHEHLQNNPKHNDVRYKTTHLTGIHWMKTFVDQKQELERWVDTHGSIEQQAVFRNVQNGMNTLCV